MPATLTLELTSTLPETLTPLIYRNLPLTQSVTITVTLKLSITLKLTRPPTGLTQARTISLATGTLNSEKIQNLPQTIPLTLNNEDFMVDQNNNLKA